jgi:uncharacterized protein (TIGR04255 family)
VPLEGRELGRVHMTRKYKNPPIIEAVCEFQIAPTVPWDLTIHGLIYEKIQKEFPHKEQRLIQNIELAQTPEGINQRVITSERSIFFTEDKRICVQIGSHLLVINCLRPYPTWQGYSPSIHHAFNTLLELIEFKELEKISLRAVNRIDIPDSSFDISHYFEFRPFMGPNLPTQIANFIIGCSIVYADERDTCKIQLMNAVPQSPDSSAFILDFDYFLAKPRSIASSQALEWVDDAHLRVDDLFEGCITDTLRELFVEDN